MTEEQIEAIVTKRFNAEMARVRRRRILILLISAAFIPMALWAATVIPNIFNDGDTLRAGQLNDNFQALASKFDAMAGKTWQIIYEADISTPTNAVTISNLNGDVDLEYQVIIRGNCATASSFLLEPNGDSSVGNYTNRGVYAEAAGSATADVVNHGALFVGYCNAIADTFQSNTFLLAKSGFKRIANTQLHSSAISHNSAGYYTGVWNNTGSNITSLQIVTVSGNGIGAGSHIEIWARR